jgi:hypothetical protein
MRRVTRAALFASIAVLLISLGGCGGNGNGAEEEGGGAELGPTLVAPPPPPTAADGTTGADGNGGGGGGQASASNEVSVGPSFNVVGAIQFGEQAVGEAGAPLVFTIKNVLQTPVVVTRVAPSGDHADDFLLVESTCDPSVELPSRGTCEASVVFRPSEPGERRGLLLVEVTGGFGRQVPLVGQGAG